MPHESLPYVLESKGDHEFLLEVGRRKKYVGRITAQGW